MDLQELLYRARQADACNAELDKIQQYQTLEEAEQDPDAPEWALWLLENLANLPPELGRRLAAKAVEVEHPSALIVLLEEDTRPLLDEDLVKQVMDRCLADTAAALGLLKWADLSSDEVQRACRKVCESSWHSLFMLRASKLIPGGLSEEASRTAQLRCCADREVAEALWKLHKVGLLPLHPEVETLLREMGIA